MPTLFPTPQEAAQQRADGGFFQGFVHNLLTHGLGLGSVAYNLINTGVHDVMGTQGQYGPATTIPGKVLSLFSGNSRNAPRALPVNGIGPVQYDSPPSPTGEVPGDAYDPNNPANYVFPDGGNGSAPSYNPSMAHNPAVSPVMRGVGGFGGGLQGGFAGGNFGGGAMGYSQGVFGGYGGGSPLQRSQALRNEKLY